MILKSLAFLVLPFSLSAYAQNYYDQTQPKEAYNRQDTRDNLNRHEGKRHRDDNLERRTREFREPEKHERYPEDDYPAQNQYRPKEENSRAHDEEQNKRYPPSK